MRSGEGGRSCKSSEIAIQEHITLTQFIQTAKKTGEGKLDSNNPETKKLVAKMFRNKTNFLKIPYLTMISLPPPIDFHVQVIKDTSRTHENTRGVFNFENVTVDSWTQGKNDSE